MENSERMEQKIDRIVEKIGAIDVTLAAQHISLKEHIRRTEILEKDVEPIKKHVAMVHGALKFIGLVSILAGIVEAVVKIATNG